MRLNHAKRIFLGQFTVIFIILAILSSRYQQTVWASANWQDLSPTATEAMPFTVPTADELIAEINNLRISYGIQPLAVHPALMKIAQEQADGIAADTPGHWRPYGLTLGQWLIMEGYPLSGDLAQDGYRSENWSFASNAQDAIEQIHFWVSSDDDIHTNTMLSTNRSDIGVGVAANKNDWGVDQVIFVIETALQTRSGQQQSAARDFLTRVPGIISGTNSINGTPLALSEGQYIIPVALSTALPNGDVFHRVQSGQALWSIAIYYGTTIEKIRNLNNLDQTNTVYEGQKLLVMKGATQPVPTSIKTPTAALLAAETTMVDQSSTSNAPGALTVTPSPANGVAKSPKSGSTPIVMGAIFLVFIILVGVIASSLKMKD
jgi:uncharacterized protein YkwD/LysM repeat protein